MADYCRQIDGPDSPPAIQSAERNAPWCDARWVCKCGQGPVDCTLAEGHSGDHAAHGTKHLLSTKARIIEVPVDAVQRVRHAAEVNATNALAAWEWDIVINHFLAAVDAANGDHA